MFVATSKNMGRLACPEMWGWCSKRGLCALYYPFEWSGLLVVPGVPLVLSKVPSSFPEWPYPADI